MNNHGGARTGAGRKPLTEGKKRVQMFFSCSEDMAELIRETSRKNGKTISQFVLDAVMGAKEMKKRYYVVAKRTNLEGYAESFTVGYDNQATDNYDNFMFFENPEQAWNWTESWEAKQWKDCTFEVVEDAE